MNKLIKVLTTLGIVSIIFGFAFLYRKDIISFYMKNFAKTDSIPTLSPNERNEYYLNKDYKFVQNTTNFVPEKKEDIINIYYTILNSGLEDFTFQCSETYKDCIADVKDISDDQTLLSNINNFVHAYNGFKNIETEYDALGKVSVHIVHTYTEDKIKEINAKVEEIEREIYTKGMSDEDKIKAVHDYIINNSSYDKERSDNQIAEYDSDTAYGNLIQGYGICGGYTDSMKIFLDRLGLPNYKIASENHVWNLVYINDGWYHLDLTWDDPVVTNGKDILEYNFFLITTEELEKQETNQHSFDGNVYQEAL